jgi:integrase
MKLTAATVAALKLDGRTDAIFFDDTLKGFGLRLRVAADRRVVRTWVLQWKRGGVSKRIVLGPANVLSAEQARAVAKEKLAQVWSGKDPAADKKERRHTLRAVIDQYLEHKRVKPRTLRDIERYLTEGFKPLHAMPVDEVSRKDIAARLVAIQHDHSDIVAAKARAAVSALYAWAMQMGLCESNPVVGTFKPPEGEARERVLSDDELVRVWNACKDDDFGKIVRLLILLGCRRAEIGGMCWSEIDLDAGIWTLPKERSKNGRAHTLPLLPMALEIIQSVPRMASRDYLFGARSRDGFTKWDLSKQQLDERCGVTDFRIHDVRRSVATGMADIGIAPHIIEEILHHQSGHKRGIAGVYNRSRYEREVRMALAQWEDHIRVLVTGGARKVLGFPQQ